MNLNDLQLSFTIALILAVTHSAVAQTVTPSRFWPEVRTYRQQDRVMGIEHCRTLFVGSSSIRFWHSLAEDMPRRRVIRRGLGGARLRDIIYYYEVLIARHRPRVIVLYAGENDIAAGRTPGSVLANIKYFLELKRQSLGYTPLYFISIKPSHARWRQFARQAEANSLIKKLAEINRDLVFVDVVDIMLKAGRPKPVFLPDGLHMKRRGYALWAKVLNRAFTNSAATAAPYCPA